LIDQLEVAGRQDLSSLAQKLEENGDVIFGFFAAAIRVEADGPIVATDSKDPGPYVAAVVVAHTPVLAITKDIEHMCDLVHVGGERRRRHCLKGLHLISDYKEEDRRPEKKESP
jgi:hypothetical protein